MQNEGLYISPFLFCHINKSPLVCCRKQKAGGAPHIHELAHGVKGGEVKVHDGAVGFGDAGSSCGGGGLGEVPAGHDHVPVAALAERARRRQAQTRGRPRNYHLPHRDRACQTQRGWLHAGRYVLTASGSVQEGGLKDAPMMET